MAISVSVLLPFTGWAAFHHEPYGGLAAWPASRKARRLTSFCQPVLRGQSCTNRHIRSRATRSLSHAPSIASAGGGLRSPPLRLGTCGHIGDAHRCRDPGEVRVLPRLVQAHLPAERHGAMLVRVWDHQSGGEWRERGTDLRARFAIEHPLVAHHARNSLDIAKVRTSRVRRQRRACRGLLSIVGADSPHVARPCRVGNVR